MIRFQLAGGKKSDAIIIPLFEGQDLEKDLKKFDKISGGAIDKLLQTKDFQAKKMQMSLVYTKNTLYPRIFLLGLGKKENCSIRVYKNALGAAVIAAQSKKIKKLSIVFGEEFQEIFDLSILGKSTVVAVSTASYSFSAFQNEQAKVTVLDDCFVDINLNTQEKKQYMLGVQEGLAIAAGIHTVRELGNTIPSVMSPEFLAKEVKKLEKETLKVKIFSKKEIERLGMGCFLGVSRGSIHEPKFIIVEYLAGDKKEAPTVLVGKGITYDSGGLSLKPADALIDMKFDMLGGATVIGIIQAASLLKLKKNLIGLIPACENMPSGSAYRPDDILTAMNGTTVLIENTDAEGRLILADALCYANKYKPKEVIDFATLTGHCLYALGNERSGLFTQDENLSQKILSSADTVGEQLWRLPLGEEFTEAIKTEAADLRNIGGVGSPRFGGASVAAAFLEYFTCDPSGKSYYPWAHIDLSCSHYAGKGKPWIREGANGFGVETMIEYLQNE